MAKLTAAQITTKYLAAYSIKSSWDTEYRDIFEYCMPARDGYDKAIGPEKITPDFQDRRENLYSSVGEQAANDFVNTLQESMCPPQSNWIALMAGSRIADNKKDKLNAELDTLSDIANEYKNNSTFDMAFSEFCYDLFAGTACLLILPGTPLQPISFKAIPLREYCIEEGKNGEVRGVYRKYTIKRELLPYQWTELKKMVIPEKDAERDITLIESTYYDYDLNVYHYQVIDEAEKKELLHREQQTNPFTVLRWNKCAGEPYGRGVGLTALADIKTLNLVKYYGLRNFAFNTPPLLVQEDAMLDVDGLELTPWSLNVVPDTKSSIVPLQINTDHDIESFKTQELTMDIKRNTYGFTLPNEGGRELTATEVRARQMEMRKSLNSVHGRLISEFQIPAVRRVFDVLKDTKIISDKFDISKINGLLYKVKIITPLSRIIMHGEAQAILAAVGTLVQFDPTGQTLASAVKLNDLMAHYLDLAGVPARFINTPDETAKVQKQQAQGQQAALNADANRDVDATNAISMGKAEAEIVKSEA